jgi:pyruvate carboxylase
MAEENPPPQIKKRMYFKNSRNATLIPEMVTERNFKMSNNNSNQNGNNEWSATDWATAIVSASVAASVVIVAVATGKRIDDADTVTVNVAKALEVVVDGVKQLGSGK